MAEAVEIAQAGPEALERKSHLLVRNFGLLAVFVFAFSSISITYSGLLPFSTVAGLWPGSNLGGTLAVALTLALIYAYTYAVIGAVAPHYAADYVVASRVISAPLAFASSWTLVVFLAIAAGSVITSLAQNIIPVFAQTLAIVSDDPSFQDIVTTITSPNNLVLVGTIGVVVTFLLLILPPHVTRYILTIGFVLALGAWAIICIQLASAQSADFPAAWDRFMGQGSFLGHLDEARRLGMQVDYSSGSMVLAGLTLGFWIFYGYFSPALFAKEVKSPAKNILLGSGAALIAGGAVLILASVLLQRLVPLEWLSAESYLNQASTYHGQTMPWIPFYAAILHPNSFLTSVVGLAWVFTVLNLAHTFLYTSSRIILAWAEDRLLPPGVAFIHPELRSPIIAVLIVSIIAEAGVVDAALSGDINSRITPVFFMACTGILPVLGVMLLPFRKRDWFAGASGFARRKIGPLPLMTVFGALSLVYLIWMIVSIILFPGFGRITLSTLIIFAVIFASGLAWFYGRRYLLMSQGDVFDDRLKTLPEE